jgi:hypothetical protein
MKIVLIFLIAITVSGCSIDKVNKVEQEEQGDFTDRHGGVRHITTDAGLECVTRKYNVGGISCNWEKYNKEQGK